MAYSTKTQRAIKTYGYDACVKAFRMHDRDGEGGSTVGFYLGLKTRQADAAIDAGREIAEAATMRLRYYTAEAGHAETKVDGLTVLDAFPKVPGCYSPSRAQVRAEVAVAHLKRVVPNPVLSFQIL